MCTSCEQHVFLSFSFPFDTPSTLDEVSTSNAAGPFYSVCERALFFLRRLTLITIIDKLRKKRHTISFFSMPKMQRHKQYVEASVLCFDSIMREKEWSSGLEHVAYVCVCVR